MGDVCTCVCTCLHVWVCQHTRVPVRVCTRVCAGTQGCPWGSRCQQAGVPPPCPCVPTRSRAGGGVQDPPHTPVTAPPATSKRPPRGEPPRPPPAAHGRASRGGTHGRWGLRPGTPPGATEPWGRVAVAVRALLLPPSAGGARSHPPVATGGLHGGSPSRVAPGHRRVTAWRRGSGDPSAWIADFGEVPLGQDPPGPHPQAVGFWGPCAPWGWELLLSPTDSSRGLHVPQNLAFWAKSCKSQRKGVIFLL